MSSLLAPGQVWGLFDLDDLALGGDYRPLFVLLLLEFEPKPDAQRWKCVQTRANGQCSIEYWQPAVELYGERDLINRLESSGYRRIS